MASQRTVPRRRFLRLAGQTGSVALTGCSSSTSPTIEMPASALVDEPIPVAVTGLDPEQSVTLRSHTHDRGGTAWESSAAFAAGADGSVTVGAQRPDESRYYDRDDGMGLFWSMRPVETGPTAPLPPGVLFQPPTEAFEVTLTAESGGRTLQRRRRPGACMHRTSGVPRSPTGWSVPPSSHRGTTPFPA
ncbi:acyl-CoA thioesterase/BAAT N-terminal domain-containing protein [Haloarcula brevis]|uniref:acyl-CoA thioesterase/BAAT N-terminal domain-containing protein n=1 Tax=Haloarcula brevis TaxID=3111453 RepID=UPI00300EA559